MGRTSSRRRQLRKRVNSPMTILIICDSLFNPTIPYSTPLSNVASYMVLYFNLAYICLYSVGDPCWLAALKFLCLATHYAPMSAHHTYWIPQCPQRTLIHFRIPLNKQISIHMLEEWAKQSLLERPGSSCGQRCCQDQIWSLKERVGQLTEAIQLIDQGLKDLTEQVPYLPKEDILSRIRQFPDCGQLLGLNGKLLYAEANNFSLKESYGLDSTLSLTMGSRIYEVPVDMDCIPLSETNEAVSADEIARYFSNFDNWSQVPNQLKHTLAALMQQADEAFQLQLLPNSKNTQLLEKCNSGFVSEKYRQQKRSAEIQTDLMTFDAREYLVGESEEKEWDEVEGSINKLQSIFSQIPSQAESLNSREVEEARISKEHEQAMQSILIEVEQVLGNIQQMLYQLPDQIFEEADCLEEEEIQIQDIYDIEDSVLKRDSNVSGSAQNEIDCDLSVLSQLILEVPTVVGSKPQRWPQPILEGHQFLERQLFSSDDDDEVDLLAEDGQVWECRRGQPNRVGRLGKRCYAIPIQMEIISDEDSIRDIQLRTNMTIQESRLRADLEEQDNLIWDQFEGRFESIHKIIKEHPVTPVGHFTYLPMFTLEAANQHCNEDYIQSCRQVGEMSQWDEIEGALGKIKTMFYDIPIEIFPYNPTQQLHTTAIEFATTQDQEAQTIACWSLQEIAGSTHSSHMDQEKCWSETMMAAGKTINQVPLCRKKVCDRIDPDSLLLPISELPISHEEYLICNYEVPTELQIQSEISSDIYDRSECPFDENTGDDTLKEIQLQEVIRLTESTQRVAIQLYQIPVQMDLIEEEQEDQEPALQGQVEKSLFQSSNIGLVSTVSVELAAFQPVARQFYEIPVEMTIYGSDEEGSEQEKSEICLCQCATQSTQTPTPELQICAGRGKANLQIYPTLSLVLAEEPQTEHLELEKSVAASEENGCLPSDSLDFPRPNQQFEIQPLKMTFKPPATSRRPCYPTDLQQSEGNITDRSIYARRSLLRNNIFQEENSNISLAIKEEHINATDYYNLLQANHLLEDERNQLSELVQAINMEVQQLRNNNRSQGNFIEAAKKLYSKQKKNLGLQISSYELKIAELERDVQKYQMIEEEQSSMIEELKESILKMKNQIGDKGELLCGFNDDLRLMKYRLEDQIKLLKATVEERNMRLVEKQEESREQLEAMRFEMADLRETNQWLKKDNLKISKELDELAGSTKQKSNKLFELMSTIESLIDGKCTDLPEIKRVYEGEFQHHISALEATISQKDKDFSVLESQINLMKGRFECQLSEKDEVIRKKQDRIDEMCGVIEKYETAFKNAASIPSQVQVELDYLRKQLIEATQQILVKDTAIMEMNIEMENLKEMRSVSSVSNSNQRESEDREAYIQELQNALFECQRVILDNEHTIKELQDQIYQYLGNSDKSSEFEALCGDIIFEGESGEFPAREFHPATNYKNIINKKLTPSLAAQSSSQKLSSELEQEFSQLSIEGMGKKASGPSANSTWETRLFGLNQSADDSCIYGKKRALIGGKKKSLNRTMKERGGREQK